MLSAYFFNNLPKLEDNIFNNNFSKLNNNVFISSYYKIFYKF